MPSRMIVLHGGVIKLLVLSPIQDKRSVGFSSETSVTTLHVVTTNNVTHPRRRPEEFVRIISVIRQHAAIRLYRVTQYEHLNKQ